jgi:hypothetical protein
MLLGVAIASGGQDKKQSKSSVKKSSTSILTKATAPLGGEEEEKMVSRRGKKNVGPTNPHEAFLWRMLAWRDENGVIDPEGRSRAVKQMSALAQSKKLAPTSYRWLEKGPDNIAGRTRSLIIDPTNSNKMFTGSVGGGIWKSTDAGTTWKVVDDRMASIAIGCMTFDPNDVNTIYAGTGEGFFNSDAIRGAGVLRSRDGGATWAILPSTSAWSYVNRIAVAPTNSNVILAAKQSGGIYRSTDGGGTWTNVLPAQVGHQVMFDPTSATKVMATVLDYNFSTGQWFTQASYSVDGGATWTAATGVGTTDFNARVEVAYAPSNTQIVYAHVGTSGGRVWKSTNGGQSFASVTTTGSTSASWYANGIWVSPTDPNFLVLTGLHVYKSTDGGVTISQIGNGYILTQQPHPDIHSITMDPGFNGTTNKRIYVGTDGGYFKADDISTASQAAGWVSFTPAVRTTQYYGARGDGVTGKIVGGTQDNGTHSMVPGSVNGTLWFGGDGGWSDIDRTDNNYVYGEYIYLQIFRSTTGGGGANWIFNGDGGANFIAPLILDPNNPNRLLGGGSALYVSDNVKAAVPTFSNLKASVGSPVSAIAVNPGASGTVWVGHNDGRVYRTTNGTAAAPTWTAIDNNAGSNPFPNRYVGRVTVDPSNTNRVWVGLGGFNNNNLWLSTDGGTTWAQRTGTNPNALPSAPIRGIAVHPTNSNIIYVGTEVGLCVSTDGGLNWSTPGQGPGNVSVDEVSFMYNSNKVLLATHGRGVWFLGPVTMSAITGPTSVTRNATFTYAISTDEIAPTGGIPINLSSSDPAITVPPTVVIPERQTSATFTATVGSAASSTGTITAALDGDTRSITLNVAGLALTGVIINPTKVIGGSAVACIGKAVLSSPAPAGGVTVTLSSLIPGAASVPASVVIGTGKTNENFVITHKKVTSVQDVKIKATYNGVTQSSVLRVQPAQPTKVQITPSTFVGGSAASVTCTVTISIPAPAGFSLKLASSDAALPVPATLAFTEGATTATFTITDAPVTFQKSVAIKATSGVLEQRGYCTMQPASPVSLTFSSNPVKGGSGTVVTGTVSLDVPAPAGGARVMLSSSLTSAATVPSAITIPAGSTSGTFTVTHKGVTSQKIVTITATYFKRLTNTITINP